jgi:hypothetical protein
MDDIIVKIIEKPKLNNTTVIEGLPGIGLVGKLAADHLIDELKAKKFAELYSVFLPPQVLIQDDGTIKLVNHEFYYVKRGDKDLIILTGDFQGITPESQYKLSEFSLDFIQQFNVDTIYTLGGLGTGDITHSPKVFGAATSKEIIEKLREHGVIFKGGGGIFGASGLLLGLGQLRGIKCACLMGETHGQIIDAKSAEAVLEVLTKIIGIEISMAKLEEKAKETEREINEIGKMIAAQKEAFEREQKIPDDIPSYIR